MKVLSKHISLIVKSGLMKVEEAQELSFHKAQKLYYAIKLVGWEYKTWNEIFLMTTQEVRGEYESKTKEYRANKINKYLERFRVGEIVWDETRQRQAKIIKIRKDTGCSRTHFLLESNQKKYNTSYNNIKKHTI